MHHSRDQPLSLGIVSEAVIPCNSSISDDGFNRSNAGAVEQWNAQRLASRARTRYPYALKPPPPSLALSPVSSSRRIGDLTSKNKLRFSFWAVSRFPVWLQGKFSSLASFWVLLRRPLCPVVEVRLADITDPHAIIRRRP